MVRIQSVPRGFHRPRFSNGWIWMIDMSIGLGAGKILTVLALRADHHEHAVGAPGFEDVRCVAVAVADSWTGETIASFLKRVIAVTGRPAAYLKDGGTDLRKALRLLGELSSPAIDDISHTIANLIKGWYLDHPLLQSFLSACGRAGANLKQTALACLTPPRVQTKSRFMNLHRLIRWADQLLTLSPPGRAAKGSMLSKLRECFDLLPSCKPFIRRFRDDATPLLECQKILKAKGLSRETMAQCEPLIETIATEPLRRQFTGYLESQFDAAGELALDELGLPISTDPLESLFGLAKLHGTGQIKDADRIAIRVPALCGVPTREEADWVLGISVAEQCRITAQFTSLSKQRRDVLPHPDRLESLANGRAHVELIPRAENRSNSRKILQFPAIYTKTGGSRMSHENGYG